MVYGGMLVGCFVLAVVLITAPPSRASVRVLQMNLCNSGLAGCYTGRSVATAVAVIRAQAPDVVTLNEVCRADVPLLERALAAGRPFGIATSSFQPAIDRRTGDPVRCLGGDAYGIALVARRPALRTIGGIYPTQNPADPEQRAWLCLDTTAFAACTTHLDSGNATVARAQCDYLLDTVVPTMRAPVALGGDFNLRSDIQGCLAAGDRRIDDGGVQNVVVSAPFAVASERLIDMLASTDHPGLLVTLALAQSPSRTAATTSVV